jgi:hypothetical protein
VGRDTTYRRVSDGAVSATSSATRKKTGHHRGGHTILVAAYHIWPDEVAYRELGAAPVDRRRRERTVAHVVDRLQRLGYHVALDTIEGEVA